jgi:hypothetical protein
MMVRLALATQAGCIDAEGAYQLKGARVRIPAIGREQPGSAHDLAFPERRHDDRRLSGGCDLERHFAVPDQEEFVGRVTLAKKVLAGIEAMVARASRDKADLVLGKAGKERVLLQDALKSLHVDLPCPPRDWREWRRLPR